MFVCCFVIKELVDRMPYKMLLFVLLVPVPGMSILDCESDIRLRELELCVTLEIN